MKKAAGRRLEHLDKKVTSVNESVSKLTFNDEVCLIWLYDKQLDTFKVELNNIYRSVLNSDKPEDEELSIQQTELAQKLFDCSLIVKRLLENNSPTPTSTPTREVIKLPKIGVPSLIEIFSIGKPSGTSFVYQYIITLTCQRLKSSFTFSKHSNMVVLSVQSRYYLNQVTVSGMTDYS